MVQTLAIRSAQGDYAAEFHESLETVVHVLKEIPRAVFLVDRNVARHYAKPLAPVLERLPHLLIDATEEEKTLQGAGKATSWLQERNCTKQSVVVAIGGGIVQDIATFSAHIYYRGVKWVFVPTTLLSMSDSCIGAKCGINLNAFKNQLGVFHSPSKVLICTRFIETLTDADVASGYGEILRLMLTGSEDLMHKLEKVVSRQGLRNPQLLELIRDSLDVKKRVIEEDEYEKDLRRVLNYGHTFGHALEAMTEHEVPHGLAVAWGLDLVNWIAVRRGMLSEAQFQWVHQFIRKHLPFKVSSKVGAVALIDGARRDKKVADGQINLILIERPGSLKIVKTSFDVALETQITEYIENHNVFDSR